MTKTFTIKDGQVPTQEQLEEVRRAIIIQHTAYFNSPMPLF